MQLQNIFWLLLAGFAGGFINSFSAAGSLFTLPALILTGMPANMANGTNRLGIFFQNIAAIIGFKSKNIPIQKQAWLLALIASIGAVIGANIAVDIPENLFKRVLSVVIVLFLLLLIADPFKKQAESTTTNPWMFVINCVVFFIAGIYGGFIQAGTGFIMMFGCMAIQRLPLPQTNMIKVLAMMAYTLPSLYIFYTNGLVDVSKGMILAVGMATGSLIGSRWSIAANQQWVKNIIIAFLCFFAIKLWVY